MKAPILTHILIPALLLFGLFTFNGCKKDSESAELKTLNENYRKWKAKNITSYSIEETCLCQIGGVHDIVVVNNAISSAKNKQGQEVSIAESRIKTIDEVFAFIESSLKGKHASARITYDPIYGYPTDTYFDFRAEMIDEETGFAIKDFQVITD
jgi:hypothetical protein